MALAALGIAILPGCGSSHESSLERAERQVKREEAGGPPADWTREEKQQFEIAKSICASEPLSQLASEWHTSADPSSVAHAYGREYRLRQDMEIATEEGCLAALVE